MRLILDAIESIPGLSSLLDEAVDTINSCEFTSQERRPTPNAGPHPVVFTLLSPILVVSCQAHRYPYAEPYFLSSRY